MAIRVNTLSMTTNAINAARRHKQNLARVQEQLVTGLRINRPSDDPVGLRKVLANRADEHRLDAEIGNIQAARVKLNSGVTRLLESKDLLVSAKTIAQESASLFEGDTLAGQIDQMYDRLLEIVNTRIGDEYLFGGTAVTVKPFGETLINGKPVVEYLGASGRESIVVGIGLTVDALYPGDDIFFAQERQPPILRGHTGATAGIGTNSGTGRQALHVRHTATTYSGGGVLAGTSSAEFDTAIGPAGSFQLQVVDTSGDGSSGTVSFHGGPTVAFTDSDTDLLLRDPRGATIYVNTTAIQAGFSGTVDVQSSGELQLEGGATTAITFSGNQVVQAADGTVTHIDTTEIRRAGTETIEHVGTGSVFEVLQQLARDLRNEEDAPDADQQDRISQSIGELDRVINNLIDTVGEQATSLESLDAIKFRHEDVRLELRRIISDIESADISEAIINLQSQQNLLQYTYSATSQLFQLSLLDYI